MSPCHTKGRSEKQQSSPYCSCSCYNLFLPSFSWSCRLDLTTWVGYGIVWSLPLPHKIPSVQEQVVYGIPSEAVMLQFGGLKCRISPLIFKIASLRMKQRLKPFSAQSSLCQLRIMILVHFKEVCNGLQPYKQIFVGQAFAFCLTDSLFTLEHLNAGF